MPTSSTVIRSDDLRHKNRHRVLNCLRAHNRSLSQTRLACETRLSAASISSLLAQLAEEGIVISRQQKNRSVARGRPQLQVELNATAGDIVTVNLSFDLIRVARVNYAQKTLHSFEHNTATRTLSEEQLLGLVARLVEQMMALPGDSEVMRIGVVFQGVTENDSGVLTWSPILDLERVNLGPHLQKTFQLPVSVDNDCKLCARALNDEFQEVLGESFATIVFTEGVGLGVYIDGKPFSGMSSSALELGHLRFERNGSLCRCGRKGCIEAYAADYGIARLATGESIHDSPYGRVDSTVIDQLCSMAEAGEEPAIQAFAIAGAAIGEGLLTLFTLLDPMPVAIVGRSSAVFELMKPQISSVVRQERYQHMHMDRLLHCFEKTEPLVNAGLVNNTLALLDNQFAYQNQT